MKIYIVEGLDGAGKSTVVGALKSFWEGQGKKVLPLREPSGYFREVLIKGVIECKGISHLNEWMAFWMGRFDVWRNEILPYQDEEIVVIIDRSYVSTYAYQIEGRQMIHFTESFFFWKETLLQMFKPGSTHIHHLYLRVSVKTGLSRIRSRENGDLTQFEVEDFQRRVKYGFDSYYSPQNARVNLSSIETVNVIDGEQSREYVLSQVLDVLSSTEVSNTETLSEEKKQDAV